MIALTVAGVGGCLRLESDGVIVVAPCHARLGFLRVGLDPGKANPTLGTSPFGGPQMRQVDIIAGRCYVGRQCGRVRRVTGVSASGLVTWKLEDAWKPGLERGGVVSIRQFAQWARREWSLDG